jgi:hypothetical protein
MIQPPANPHTSRRDKETSKRATSSCLTAIDTTLTLCRADVSWQGMEAGVVQTWQGRLLGQQQLWTDCGGDGVVVHTAPCHTALAAPCCSNK